MQNINEKLTDLFRKRFSSPHRPYKSRYEINVKNSNEDGSVFDLEIYFLKDQEYCCIEVDCHLGLHTIEDWQGLRKHFHQEIIKLQGPIMINVKVKVQEGAYTLMFGQGGKKVGKNRCSAMKYNEKYEEKITNLVI